VTDDERRALEAAADLADREADTHRPTCGAGKFLRAAGEAIRASLAGGSGPAQVATPAYRENWDTLFGKKQTVGQA
jgi:hypothetical protein